MNNMNNDNTPEGWDRANREQAKKLASKGSLEGRYPVRLDSRTIVYKKKTA